MKKSELLEKISKLPKTNYFSVTQGRNLLKENEDLFRSLIKKRINHCETQLEANLSTAKTTGMIVVWEGGHFCLPVWEALKEAEQKDITSWNALVWEQIIRQMSREDQKYDAVLWDIASEMCLCESM